ncbi:leucine rich adaptor protein 1 [Thalassophryne amazonica]|uniref:leucine rich adaptor protein 1 n=1 Tax=Thalassophryne amazonica TaxID=390379 RepID=UPI0014717E5A|nr:leucine rich adaptor protein 1 [Thalassophryne amazonica]
MDEGTVTGSDAPPDLKDIEVKMGRKIPDGLLRWMREEASPLSAAHDASTDTSKKSLDEKIRKLKMEMAHLRSVDVKILQQLLALHEGIEAVKWLLEERSTLTSRCSSLTSSQYSLGEGPDTSWRGSWSSLQDPNDKLDNISVGSYLDTLADDMDEYCASSSESVICSSTPLVSEVTVVGRTVGGPGASGAQSGTGVVVGVRSGTAATRNEVGSGSQVVVNEGRAGAGNGMDLKRRSGTGPATAVTGSSGTGSGNSAVPVNCPQSTIEGPKQDTSIWNKAEETAEGGTFKNNAQTNGIMSNAIKDKTTTKTGGPEQTRANLKEKLGMSQSPKRKPYKNGKIDMDTCKMNGKLHLEYDAHWRWVQSQEDVTFL